MKLDRRSIFLICVNSVNLVFFSIEKIETVLISIVFVALAMLILKLTTNRSKALFWSTAVTFIIVQIIIVFRF